MKCIAILLISFAQLFLVGCSSWYPIVNQAYSGERLSDEKGVVLRTENATLTVSEKLGRPDITFRTINGKSMFVPPAILYSNGYPHLVYLKPGRHTVTVELHSYQTVGFYGLWFEGEAGKSYVVKTSVEGNYWRAWIVDESNNEEVGGPLSRQ